MKQRLLPSMEEPGAERRPKLSMPATPSAARAQAANDIADRLIADTSPYALHPGDPDAVRDLCSEIMLTQECGIPQGTESSNKGGFNWALDYCNRTNQPIMRPLVLTPTDKIREPIFYAGLFLHIAKYIQPRRTRTDDKPAQGKPSSGLLALLGYRRVLASCLCELVSLLLIYSMLKGLNARFKERWGKHALVVRHMQCFKLAQLHTMVAKLRAYDVPDWTTERHDGMLIAVLYMLHSAARNDEVVESFAGDTYPLHSEFEWYEGGVLVPATRANISALKDGALLQATTQPSKADRGNTEWGNKPMHFRLKISEPLNFASAWRIHQLKYFVDEALRPHAAAFSPHANIRPYRGNELQTDFKTLLVLCFGAAIALLHSLHALRVTMACVLLAHKRSDGRIQAICR